MARSDFHSPQANRKGNVDPYHDGSKVQVDHSDQGESWNAGAREIEDEKPSMGPSGYPIRK